MAIDWNLIGIWVGAFYTIGFFTLAVGVNPWLRFVESTWVGTVFGFAMVVGIRAILTLGVDPISKGQIWMFVPLVLGALLFSRFVNQYRHFSKWGVALMIGVGTGLGIRGAVDGMLLKQIEATFISPIVPGNALQSFDNIVIIVMVLTTLAYFLFSVDFKAPSDIILKLGRWSMMIAFGAGFGNTVTFRINLFIERWIFLLTEWLKL
jgi:hypothetical protein